MSNLYPTLGSYTVVPAADLASATSAVNARGDTRKGSSSFTVLGKYAGMELLSDLGNGTYKQYIALGAAATSIWQLVDGSAQVTPA